MLKRSKGLQSNKPLERRAPLKRKTGVKPVSDKRRADGARRKRARKAVQERDQVCQWPRLWMETFGTTSSDCMDDLTPHHIVKAGQCGAYSEENMIALCARHNGDVENSVPEAKAMGLVKSNGPVNLGLKIKETHQ